MQLEADLGKPEKESKRERRFVMAYEALYNVPQGRVEQSLPWCPEFEDRRRKFIVPGNRTGMLQGLR
jgi:hypothetical protein